MPLREVLAVVLALAAAFCLLRWLLRQLAARKSVTAIPLSTCRSAAQGYVRLYGRQKYLPSGPLKAPWSGKPCTGWSCQVEHYQTVTHGDPDGLQYATKEWVPVSWMGSTSLVVLDDGTGQVLVNLDGGVIPITRTQWRGDCATPSLPPTEGSNTGDYRYTEARMDAGDPIYVAGDLTTHSVLPGAASVEQITSTILTDWKANQAKLLEKFDADHSGNIDMDEWEHARELARAEANRRVRNRQNSAIHGLSIVSKPTDGKPLQLSFVRPDDPQHPQNHYKYATPKHLWIVLFFVFGATALLLWL